MLEATKRAVPPRGFVGLSNAGVVFQQIQNLPSSTDEIARIAGLPKNPLTGELKTAGDKLLGEIKNTALQVGKKILKGAVSTGVSAVTSLMAGASLGNLIPIPGIGSAIGAVGALVWEGLKALGKALLKALRPKPQPYQRKCPKFEGCPQMPQMAVVDMIPWLGPQRVVVHEKLTNQLKKHYCGYGGIRDCAADLSYYWKEAFKITIDTIPYLGLPQIERLLTAYRNTPSQFKQLNKRNQIETFTATEPSTVIYNLEFRRKKLADLMSRAQQATTLPSNQVPKLRWDLATEMTKAASQVQISQSPETLGWYKALGDAVLKLTAREQADTTRLKQQAETSGKRAAEVMADPRRKAEYELTILKMQCGEGIQSACAEVKKRTTAGAQKPADTQARNRFVYDYLQRLAAQGNQAAQLLAADAARQPGQFPAAKTYAYLERRAREGVQAAKTVLFAALSEFGKGAAAAAPAPALAPATFVPAPDPKLFGKEWF